MMVEIDGSAGLVIRSYAFAAKGSQLIPAIMITFIVILTRKFAITE